MISLKNTSELLKVVTGAAIGIDVSVSYVDITTTAASPATQETKIATGTTTTILSVPGASTIRQVRFISLTNIGVSSDAITVLKDNGTNTFQLIAVTLLAGESLQYANDGRWYYYGTNGAIKGTTTAAGNTTELQLNSAGALSSSPNLTFDPATNTFTLNGTSVNLKMGPSTTIPATLSGFVNMFMKTTVNAMAPWFKRNQNAAQALQGALWGPNIVLWVPQVATGLFLGTTGATGGAGAAVQPTTTSNYTLLRRSTFASLVTTTNQTIGVNTDLQFLRGASAGQGGFLFVCKFGFTTWTAGDRIFIGMASNASTVISANPSALANTCGFGIDDTDTAFTFMHNDASGTAVKDTIAGQPTVASGQGYIAYIYCAPNDSTIYYRLDDLNAGTIIIDSSAATDIPVNTTLMAACAKMSNGANTVVGNATIGVNRLYVETDL